MSDQLIAEYLRELKVSAWIRQLSPAQTSDLENEVGATIAAALTVAGKRNEATVYGVLDRLGPPGEIVAQQHVAPPSGARQVLNTAFAPVTRVRATLLLHGWGVAEIGGLFLPIVGPFLLWWIGPIFGMLIVRAGANRWSDRTMHIATVVVGVLFLVQALMALVLFASLITNGGSAELQQVLSAFARGGFTGGGLAPPTGTSAGLGSLSLAQIVVALPAPLAGLSAGIYLALSPRHRRFANMRG